jgi:2-polyprenyl-6-methoxyphenol hydroxylase-like FAD-dependent oxidoreductase
MQADNASKSLHYLDMASLHVSIIGGGVAGFVTAIALQRANIASTVYEAWGDPADEAGAFFTIATNGLRALRSIGCLDVVVARGFLVPRMKVWSGSGRLLGDVPRSGSDYSDTPSLTVRRGRFVATLREVAQQRGVCVVAGKRLARIDDDRQLVFADGTSTSRGAVVVGADGLHSRVRRLIDVAAPEPVYVGLVQVWGSSPASDIDLAPGTFHMVYGRRAFFGAVREPGGAVWWFAQVPTLPEPDRASLARITAEEWRSRLLDLALPDRTVIASLIATSDVLHRASAGYSVARVPVWCRDDMVVIGDAAHAVGAGQGASMAIEDGVVLAKCLSTASRVSDGLARYERLRRQRVERVLEGGKANGAAKTSRPFQRRIADLLAPIFFRFFYRRSTEWLFTYDAGGVA